MTTAKQIRYDRFKFRVWIDEIGEYGEGELFSDGSFYGSYEDGMGATIDGCDGTIEFCTGLKDKNGKLIYEGDIVSFESRGGKPKAVSYDERDEPHMINPLWFIGGTSVFGWGAWEEQNCDVIGNIHENGDLLEAPNEG
jgi:uncharacterized phage protein (TIGR01671 family)